MKKLTMNPIKALTFLFGAVALLPLAAHATDPKPTISVTGAQAGSGSDYYVVEVPEESTTKVTLTASGQPPTLDDSEKCKCDPKVQDPEKDGNLKYTFSKTLGTQETGNGPKITIDVTSSTAPGEYKFKVTDMKQKYKPCDTNWTQGASNFTEKSNTTQSDEVTLLVYKVETETIVASPTDRKRKKLGVGEEVNITLTPSAAIATWSVEGGKGTISPASGAESRYTAHNKAATAKVRASIKGVDKTIIFTVIQPSNISMEVASLRNSKSPFIAGFDGNAYILPDDVNFEKITVYEGECNPVTIGYFANPKYVYNSTKHEKGNLFKPTGHIQGKGTVDGGNPDWVYMEAPYKPYLDGAFTWPIEWRYKLNGADVLIKTVYQTANLTVTNGTATLTETKAGASGTSTNP